MTPRPARPGRRRPRAALALLAAVLLAAGTALATVARPAREVVLDVGATATAATAGGEVAAPLLVLEPSVLTGPAGASGEVVVRASGPGAVLLAAGRDDDVAAWAEGTSAVVVSDDDDALGARTATGGATAPDPAGSDLWTAQARGTGIAELAVDPAGGATAVLVAADGTAPAPSAVEVVRQHRPVPPVAWALLGAGALLLVVAARWPRGSRGSRRPAVVELPETALVPPAAPGPQAPDEQPGGAPSRRTRGRRAAR